MLNEVFETIKAIIACVFCILIGYIGGYLMRHLKEMNKINPCKNCSQRDNL